MSETRKVILVGEHTHCGIKHYPGEELELPLEDAEWLASAIVDQRIEANKAEITFSTEVPASVDDLTT